MREMQNADEAGILCFHMLKHPDEVGMFLA
jgi:hypothetical protein